MNQPPETWIKPKVTLVGKDGNAFVILGYCQSAAKKAGNSKEDIDALMDEMQSSDYNHLLATASEWFDVS